MTALITQYDTKWYEEIYIKLIWIIKNVLHLIYD